MVAYSFKSQFVEPIITGRKEGTIRGQRKRHARVGEQLQLYTAMRTKACRLISNARCIAVRPIKITFSKRRHHDRVSLDGVVIGGYALDAFALNDGFNSWLELRAFWAENHPGLAWFEGVWIRWSECEGGLFADRYYR